MKEELLHETKRHEMFISQQKLEQLTESYPEEVDQQQQQWLIDLFNYFSRNCQIIETFLINLGQQFRRNFSRKIDYSILLLIPVVIAHQTLLDPTNLLLFQQIPIENLQLVCESSSFPSFSSIL